ncbi:MAG TPA: hypothetical protein VH643_35165 [Gemmataceae bacterium]|jgi:hypothetical protein
MRYFQPPTDTRFYTGVDLHARALFLVVLDHTGQTRYARNLPANPQAFRKAIAPFRDGLVVACECMRCWYWLADTCRDDNIPFLLGHAWGMKAVHGSKSLRWPSMFLQKLPALPQPNAAITKPTIRVPRSLYCAIARRALTPGQRARRMRTKPSSVLPTRNRFLIPLISQGLGANR